MNKKQFKEKQPPPWRQNEQEEGDRSKQRRVSVEASDSFGGPASSQALASSVFSAAPPREPPLAAILLRVMNHVDAKEFDSAEDMSDEATSHPHSPTNQNVINLLRRKFFFVL